MPSATHMSSLAHKRLLLGALTVLLLGLVPGPALAATDTGVGHRNPTWVATHDIGDYDDAVALGVDPGGRRVFVTGSGGSENGSVMDTIAYDAATGAQAWLSNYEHGVDEVTPVDLVVAADGSQVFVLACVGYPLCSNGRFVTIAYDAETGTQQWIAFYAGSGHDNVPSAMAPSTDGSKLFVTGSTQLPGETDFVTLAYSTDSGALQWTSLYRTQLAFPVAVEATPTNLVVVTGRDLLIGAYDEVTVAYDELTGEQRWSTRLDLDGGAFPTDMAMSPDGNRAIVVAQAGYKNQLAVATYDTSSGSIEWTDRTSGRTMFGPRVAVDGGGTVGFVGGATITANLSHEVALFAYDLATGDKIWLGSAGTPGKQYDTVSDLTFDPIFGRVYVAGCVGTMSGDCSTGSDYGVMAFDAGSGALLWVGRYNGLGDGIDHPRAIVAAPDGATVYMTGQSDDGDPSFDYDFATTAFPAEDS